MALSDSVRPLVRPETVEVLLELATRERQDSNDHLDVVERKLTAVLTAAGAYVAILAGLGFTAERQLLFGGVALGGLAALVSVWGLWPQRFPAPELKAINERLAALHVGDVRRILLAAETAMVYTSRSLGNRKACALRWAAGLLAAALLLTVSAIVIAGG